MTARTALYSQHLSANGKMVDFHGWEMPLHYGSQINEHHQVRKSVGVFDVSHMTILDILGAGCRQFLRNLLTNDIDQLSHTGQALYSCMCNEHGGIIDDLIVYQRAADSYRLILNSACREKDLAWIRQQAEGLSVGLQERNELGILAVQGPQSLETLQRILSPGQADPISTLTPFECVDVADWFFARTGYTGEDGMEIILPNTDIAALWQDLLSADVKPCGLGARDTLRLEAGMMLYGQDMTSETTPLESGLAWTVKFVPEDRTFVGKGALLTQKNQGIKRKIVGLILDEKAVLRSGQTVTIEGAENGIITSGTFSPTLGYSIAIARVPVECTDRAKVTIREKEHTVRVVKPRFVKHGQSLVG